MTSGIGASQHTKNKGTSLALKAQSFSSLISFQFSILSTCLSQFCFIYIHINHLTFRMQIFFSKCVALSMMVRLLFVATFNSHILISITFNCAFINVCTFVDGCIFVPTMSSSLASIYIACASIDCHSTTSFSFDSSIKSIDVVLGHVYKLTHQHFLLLHKNSITDVLI